MTYSVKFWPRVKGVDAVTSRTSGAVRFRQLQRLAAVPGADDLFVHMLGNGKDGEGFDLVLDQVKEALLKRFCERIEEARTDCASAPTPRAPNIVGERQANGRGTGIARFARGDITETLDPWAVLTALSDEPDFSALRASNGRCA